MCISTYSHSKCASYCICIPFEYRGVFFLFFNRSEVLWCLSSCTFWKKYREHLQRLHLHAAALFIRLNALKIRMLAVSTAAKSKRALTETAVCELWKWDQWAPPTQYLKKSAVACGNMTVWLFGCSSVLAETFTYCSRLINYISDILTLLSDPSLWVAVGFCVFHQSVKTNRQRSEAAWGRLSSIDALFFTW